MTGSSGKTLICWDKEQCDLCGLCIAVCPEDDALVFKRASLIMNFGACRHCGRCLTVCPFNALEEVTQE